MSLEALRCSYCDGHINPKTMRCEFCGSGCWIRYKLFENALDEVKNR